MIQPKGPIISRNTTNTTAIRARHRNRLHKCRFNFFAIWFGVILQAVVPSRESSLDNLLKPHREDSSLSPLSDCTHSTNPNRSSRPGHLRINQVAKEMNSISRCSSELCTLDPDEVQIKFDYKLMVYRPKKKGLRLCASIPYCNTRAFSLIPFLW